MADVSDKRINTLTQTASQTPQFQPSSDPVQGVLGAAQMGLDFYAKQQAQEQLQAIEAQQAQSQNTIAQAALELRNRRQELASQGADAVKIMKEEKRILSRYDSSTAFEIVGAANKVSGRNLGSTINAADDVTKDAEAKAKQDFDQRQLAQSLRGYVGYDLPDSATEEEVEKYILRGTAEQSIVAARTAKATADIKETSSGEAKREIGVRAMSQTITDTIAKESQGLINKSMVMLTSGNAGDRKQAASDLEAQIAMIPSLVDQVQVNSDYKMTAQEKNALVSQLQQPLTDAVTFLSSDTTLSIDKNTKMTFVNNMIETALRHPDQAVRASAVSVMSDIAMGNTPDAEALKNLDIVMMKEAEKGNLWTAPSIEQQSADRAAREQETRKFNAVMSTMQTLLKSQDPQRAEPNYVFAINNFTGPPEKFESPRQQQVLQKTVQGIANAGPMLNMPEGKKLTVAEEMKNKYEPLVVRTLAAFLEEGQSSVPPSFTTSEGLTPPTVKAQGVSRYEFNPKTLQVRPVDPGMAYSSRANNLNKILKEMFTAYENLGYDSEPLKEDLRNAYATNPEGDNNG